MSLSAITTTGGTFHRLVSGAENILTRVELYAGEQLIESIYSESITVRNLMLQTNEHKNRFYRLLGNDISANLVTKAGSAQDLIISIPSFYNTGNVFFLKGLTVPLRLRFYIQSLADVVVTDGTAPVCSIQAIGTDCGCGWRKRPTDQWSQSECGMGCRLPKQSWLQLSGLARIQSQYIPDRSKAGISDKFGLCELSGP